MEAMLAAYGSGCAMLSHQRGMRVLNVDIGGGTTKLAIIDDGNVVSTAALHLGGRLAVVSEDGTIVRLDPAGRELAAREGIFCGISAGGTFAAALAVAGEAPAGSVLLAMLPDTGERYLSTPLFEGVPSVLKMKATWSLSTSFVVAATAFAGLYPSSSLKSVILRPLMPP